MEFNRSIDVSQLPQANIQRSVFDRSAPLYTTFNTGQLVPLYIDDVLPGDSFKVETSTLARLQTLLTPMMGRIFLDVYWFYVPARLCWSHFREFMGENTTSAWTQQVEYTLPHNTSSGTPNTLSTYGSKTIGDYLGIPTKVPVDIDALPFRAYCLVWNEFFRDENLQDPVLVNLGDNGLDLSSIASTFDMDLWSNKLNYAQYGITSPLPANKYHDIFTSCLPSPQKGPDVNLTLGGFAPVVTASASLTTDQLKAYNLSSQAFDGYEALTWFSMPGAPGQSPSLKTQAMLAIDGGGDTSAPSASSGYTGTNVFPSNLVANLDYGVNATINDLRLAMATQRFYESLARGGSRYTELLSSIFGVDSPDARLQRPEYLGGSHSVLNVDQVVQLSESSENSPLGDTGAYSLSFNSDFSFEKSFVEHGYLLCVGTARYEHNYQQGLRKMWSRKDKFDYYWPQFANIGEVPVLSKELYCDGSSSDDNVFGYQEAWYEYRYNTVGACVTGEMRSNYSQSLDVWHLADDYSSRPTLSSSWIMEDKSNVDRVLTETSSDADQILLNAFFDIKATRPLPVYSIPGGLDFR